MVAEGVGARDSWLTGLGGGLNVGGEGEGLGTLSRLAGWCQGQ